MAVDFITREEHASAISDVKQEMVKLNEVVVKLAAMADLTQKQLDILGRQVEQSNKIFQRTIKVAADQAHIKEQLALLQPQFDKLNNRIDRLNERIETETLNRVSANNSLSERISTNASNTGWMEKIGGKTIAVLLSVIMLFGGAVIKSLFDKG